MAKKLTISEQYDLVVKFLKDNEADDALITFVSERKEQHDNKNANRKPSAKQVENEGIKRDILDKMEAEKFYTISDIQKLVGLDSNQRTSQLVTQLKDKGFIIREEKKGRAYFAKA